MQIFLNVFVILRVEAEKLSNHQINQHWAIFLKLSIVATLKRRRGCRNVCVISFTFSETRSSFWWSWSFLTFFVCVSNFYLSALIYWLHNFVNAAWMSKLCERETQRKWKSARSFKHATRKWQTRKCTQFPSLALQTVSLHSFKCNYEMQLLVQACSKSSKGLKRWSRWSNSHILNGYEFTAWFIMIDIKNLHKEKLISLHPTMILRWLRNFRLRQRRKYFIVT